MGVIEATYLVFDADRTPLGEFSAPLPSFREGVDGIDTLTVELPRLLGTPDREGLYTHGNWIEVWATDERTLTAGITHGLIGMFIIGESTIAQSAGLSRLLYTGTIEDSTETVSSLKLTLLSLARIPDQTPIAGELVLSGDPVTLARRVVADYLPGLTWDYRNPAASGETVTAATWTDPTAAAVLAGLRDLAGEGWRLFVTGQGSVRILAPPDPAVAEADHTLTIGAQAVEPELYRDAKARLRLVRVVGATLTSGSTSTTIRASAQTTDYRASDPRGVTVAATHLTTAADAGRLAELTLAARNRVTLRGIVRVPREGYDTLSLQVGDSVRLVVEQPVNLSAVFLVGLSAIGEAAIGSSAYLDYDQPLAIAGIARGLLDVRLELSEPAPDVARLLAAMARESAATARRSA